MHRLAVLLVALLALPAAAEPDASTRAARQAERAALRQKLRAAPGEWVRDVDRWVETRPGLCDATSCGTVRVAKIRGALVMRAYVPEARNGQAGFAVHQLVRAITPENTASATAGSKHSSEEAKTKQAFLQTVKYASTEFLRSEPLSTLYRGALDEVARDRSTDKTELLRRAASGLAGCLNDRYTCFMEPRAARDWADRSKPTQVGAGFRLESRGGALRVKEVLPGPAVRSGLRPNDRLISVDGQTVGSLTEAQALLRGDAGRRLRLTVQRGTTTQVIEIVYGAFKAYPLASSLRDGVGVIRLPKFYDGSARDVIAAIGELERSSGGLRGLVLDLRGNPGGSRPEWVRLLNEFLPGGSLGTNRGQGGKLLERFDADPAKAGHATLPLALLVDGKSASASERMAAVLKDRRRALLVGETTFGKDVGQTTHPLADGSSFKVTNVRFHVPSGTAPGAVTPDVTTAQATRALGASPEQDVLVGFAVRALLRR
jgi:carboxyl-terminal processing protease